MSAEIRKEVERLSIELEDLKKLSYSGLRKISPRNEAQEMPCAVKQNLKLS